MNLFIVTVGALICALWAAWRYKNPGAIGLGGVAIAALGALNHESNWTGTVLLLSGGLFVIGMLVNRAVDDLFHWGALLVNALPWAWALLATIFGWSVWRDTSEAPTVLIVIGILALIACAAYLIWRLAQRFSPARTN